MELKVICKRLITEELDESITEGEYGADVIGVTVPRFYGEHDLSEFSFRITAVSKTNESVAEQVMTMDKSDEEAIHLLWTVTSDFTASSGEITLVLAGVNSDNSVQIKFISQPVTINDDCRLEFIESPTLIEQAYNQVQLEVQKAVDAAERAEEAASRTAILEAATETELGGIKAGGDISVSEEGEVTVYFVNGKTIEADVPENAVFTDTVYTLPMATENVLGGVKVDGSTISVNGNGIISTVENSDTSSVTASKTLPCSIDNAVDYLLFSLNLYGKSLQDGTPSQESPVDIASIGDDGKVTVTFSGKNLLDLRSAKTMGGSFPVFLNNGFRTNAKDDDSRIIVCRCNLIAGRTYYFSYDYETENTNASVVAYARGGGGEQYGIGNRSFVALYNSTEIGFYIPNASVSDNVYFTVTNPQIEEGTTKSDFEQFKGSGAAQITSGLPLCSVGNVRDELVFNADGTGKIIKRTAKLSSYADEDITGNYISSTGGLDTGAEVIYVLDDPFEIQLTATETASLGKLQTFNGITYVNAYDGANMSLCYCRSKLLGNYVFPLIKRFI